MKRKLVPYPSLFKTISLISMPALMVLAGMVIFDMINLATFFGAYFIILIGSTVFAWPFLFNVGALTRYVQELAQDKKVLPPDLGFLSMIVELSEALVKLQRIWEVKKQQLERIITEREILVDTLPDVLIMINDERKIIRTNRAARAIFGQNLAGKLLDDVIENDALTDNIMSVVEDLRGREVEFRIEDPVLRDFLAVIERFPIPSAGGMSVVITMNDITELKSVEQMRADFVANASHEIRTPLASIAGFIETLQGPARDDEQAREEFLRLMAEQADRMKQLINDLLSLSKIEMNAHSVPMDPVDMGLVIKRSSEMLRSQAKAKNVSFKLDIQEALPQVKGDMNELAQVMHNLMGNAIKYGASDSEVVVTARVTTELPRDQSMRNMVRVVRISVKDEGDGIAKEHLARLTERFYRIDSARTRTVGGTGLGLAIVKGILMRHRGVITIDSVVGKGSSFNVFLPLYEDA
jgi:two-component system phosphate regulon sensor histidine kinase PhoR